MGLTKEQIQDNERYFSNVLSTLSEGGVYAWKDLGEILFKRNGKLICPYNSYEIIRNIVSNDFFEKTFELKK